MIQLVIHNHYNEKTNTVKINDISELDRFAEEYGIGLNVYSTPSRDLTEEAQLLAEYLSNHHLDVEVVTQDNLNEAHKALKDLYSQLINLPELMHKSDDVDLYDRYRPQLEAIASKESSSHKRRVHNPVNKGVHAGTQSLSSYGIMPITVHWTALKHPSFKNTETGKLILSSGGKDHVSALANWKKIANITNERTHDDVAAAHVWDFQKSLVSQFTTPDHNLDAVTAYAHNQGVTAAREKLKKPGGYQEILEHPYVRDFLNYMRDNAPKTASNK